jgi:methylisocitrate lyase
MLFPAKSPIDKRRDFKAALKSGRLLRFPGAFSPLVSMLIEQIGFDGIYISGAALANDLGYPDIGLTTLTEVTQRGRAIARVSSLPTLIDADTGFGETMNVARTIQELEDAGLCGCHLEDQVNPKRCGHLDGKSLIPPENMIKKIQAAVASRRDDNFIIMARTDARASEGLDQAIARAKAYIAAGADAIFPEALQNIDEFAAFRDAIDAPILANMTEFGKTKLLTAEQLSSLGYNIVIYPVTSLRIAMKAVEDALTTIYAEGTQESLLSAMQHRKALYELIRYEDYNQFDQNIFNFKI